MLKSSIISIVVLLVLFCFSPGHSQQSKETKTVLIICGLSPAQPAYRLILGGIRQKLTEQFGDEYTLHTEYLEIESYPKGDYPKEKFDIYNEKYKDIKLDLLICVGRNTIGIIQKNAEDYLQNLPTISMDFDFSNYGIKSDLKLNEQTAVVGMKFNLDNSIATALSLFPKTTSIYFVGGTTPFDKFLMSLATEVLKKNKSDKKAIFINNESMDKILHQVRSLPAGSLIFVPSFNTDLKNVTYYNPEAIRLISTNANAPVFAYTDMGFGDGAVGGYLMSFEKAGLLSGEYAVKILNGANPNSFSTTEKDYYDYVFDWRQLKRWNLVDSDLIPKGSTILFVETNFIDKYKWIGGLVFLFLILQSLLIANLIRLNRNQKVITAQIIETQNKYRDFLHQDRSLRLGQLAAFLSHELNQPLTAILSTAQAGINFINSNEATPDLLKQILQKIVDNDKRTASILSSIRGMLKLESKEKEKVNLNSLTSEILDVYKSEALKFDTQLSINLPLETVYVMADPIQIQQVILNLIINASHSLEKNNIKNKTITVSLLISDKDVIVSVEDNGSGIDETIKEKLFRPFTTSKTEGMGIGLVICRTIIEDHNGKIWADNITLGGANFSFSLEKYKDE